MSIRSRFFAATYDRMMKEAEKAGLTEMRRALLAQAAGTVLEVGGGTGANLSHYRPTVTSLTITEPDAAMLKRLERRVSAQGPRPLSFGPRPRTSPSKMTPSTWSSPPWCFAGSTTSRGPSGRSSVSCGPRAGCCSSSTSALGTRRSLGSRTR